MTTLLGWNDSPYILFCFKFSKTSFFFTGRNTQSGVHTVHCSVYGHRKAQAAWSFHNMIETNKTSEGRQFKPAYQIVLLLIQYFLSSGPGTRFYNSFSYHVVYGIPYWPTLFTHSLSCTDLDLQCQDQRRLVNKIYLTHAHEVKRSGCFLMNLKRLVLAFTKRQKNRKEIVYEYLSWEGTNRNWNNVFLSETHYSSAEVNTANN